MFGKHRGQQAEEPLPKRNETPHGTIPRGGPRPVNVGMENGFPLYTECFRCGKTVCKCN